MEHVTFISTETGTDLIVSYAVRRSDDSTEIESLTVMRCPKYERLLPEHERGATVSFEREEDLDRFALLLEVEYASAEKVVHVRSAVASYKLEVGRVDPKELKKMCDVLRLMNFDSSIKLVGI